MLAITLREGKAPGSPMSQTAVVTEPAPARHPAPLDLDALLAHEPFRSAVQRLGAAPTPARVAVLLPCHNEGLSIAGVVAAFRAELPEARIVVYDNASSDDTAERAEKAGAEVYYEPRPGKGNVVRRMFAEVEADVYLMADGDGTYEVAAARRLLAMVTTGRLDMAVGARRDIGQEAHRRGHALGNRLFNGLYARVFGAEFGDIFSGYRAFSRRFVKSFPALSTGFEIETELSVHATQLKLPTGETTVAYGKRQEGSASKLRTVRDGWRILATLLFLLKETRPALFFGGPAIGVASMAMLLALPLFGTFWHTGLVPRLPTAILCTGLMLIASILAVCGLILDSVARGRAEQKRILFLAVSNRRD